MRHELEKIQTPLSSKELIAAAKQHKEEIGTEKSTYMDGVLFGYALHIAVPCIWEKQHAPHTSVLPDGGVYIRGCDGKPHASMVDIGSMNDEIFCSGCGHIVKADA